MPTLLASIVRPEALFLSPLQLVPRCLCFLWKSNHSFGRDDLLVLAKVADLTHTRIHQLQREEAKSQND